MDLEEALQKIEEYENKTTDLASQLEALKQNNQALVDEKRSESEKRRQIEKDAREKAEALAKASGDYESVVEAAKAEKEQALEKLTALERRVAEKEISSIASKLAHEIAHDSDAAELLEEQFAKRLKYEDDQVKIITSKDGSSVSTIEDLKKEFLESKRFKLLVKQNPASGGRPIGANGSPVPSDSTRKLSPVERINLARGVK